MQQCTLLLYSFKACKDNYSSSQLMFIDSTVLTQAVRKGLEKGPLAGYEAEADGFAELGMTSESKALKSLFFGRVRRNDCIRLLVMWWENTIAINVDTITKECETFR